MIIKTKGLRELLGWCYQPRGPCQHLSGTVRTTYWFKIKHVVDVRHFPIRIPWKSGRLCANLKCVHMARLPCTMCVTWDMRVLCATQHSKSCAVSRCTFDRGNKTAEYTSAKRPSAEAQCLQRQRPRATCVATYWASLLYKCAIRQWNVTRAGLATNAHQLTGIQYDSPRRITCPYGAQVRRTVRTTCDGASIAPYRTTLDSEHSRAHSDMRSAIVDIRHWTSVVVAPAPCPGDCLWCIMCFAI